MIDRAQLRELSSTLPKAFSTLATEFESSGSPFVSLIQHFSAEADNVFQLEKVEQLHPLPETEESRQEDDVVRRGREMKGERRNLADEAFRTSEIQKWNALEKVSRVCQITIVLLSQNIQLTIAVCRKHTATFCRC